MLMSPSLYRPWTQMSEFYAWHFHLGFIYQKCGTEQRTKYVDISRIAEVLGDGVCRALPALHAFTGCDSISSFAGKGKLAALKLVKGNVHFQELFQEIGVQWTLTEDLLTKVQAFTCKLYSAKDDLGDINELRYKLFCAKKGEVESYQLPPCFDSFKQHAQRACYQAAVWHRSLEASSECPSPVGHGWVLEMIEGKQVLVPHWMEGQPAPVAVLELLACKCKSKPCEAPRCTCVNNGLPCTDMCKHKAEACTNKPVDDDPVEDDLLDDEEDDNDY